MSPDGPVSLPHDIEVTVVKRGGWGKADVLKLRDTDGERILKDFSGKAWPVRWFGRRQLRRERRALRRLRGVPGVPRDLGELPPWGLLLESLPGDRINRFRVRTPPEKEAMLARLRDLVERIHERGVVHLDLRKRDNILVDQDGRPRVIDFNASVCLDPGSLAGRLLLPSLRRIDRGAVLKWRSLLLPGGLDEHERRRHRRMSRLRRFWIFN